MPRPLPFHLHAPVEPAEDLRGPRLAPSAPVLSPNNAWIKRFDDEHPVVEVMESNTPRETFNELLEALQDQTAGNVEYALNLLGFQEPGLWGPMSLLGRLWLHEDDPATGEVLFQGLDLLRPGAMATDDDRYRQEILGLMYLVVSGEESTTAGLELRAPRLKHWLGGLVAERGTNLALSAQDVAANTDDVNPTTFRALASHLESFTLRQELKDPSPDLVPDRDRRRL